MTTVEPEAAGKCPVHNYSPYELKPLGQWSAFYDQIRDESPVVWNEFRGGGSGYFLITRHEEILAVLQDQETFTTDSVVAYEPAPNYRWIPEMLGGMEHRQWRKELGPYFSPREIERIDAGVRDWARELISGLVERGSCDLMKDFALKFPTAIILDLVGLPVEDLEQLLEWEEDIIHAIGDPGEVVRRKVQGITNVKRYLTDKIADRRVNPRDDLMTKSLAIKIDGEPVSDDDLLNFWQFLVQAGLDSVAGMLGYFFHHLATHQDDRQRFVDEPEFIEVGMEELLRHYSFIVSGRKVSKDTEVAGCPIPAGSMVQVLLRSSGRDERFYQNPGEVDLDRGTTNHLAFGAGVHRCLGSHLARRELLVALEEWHKVIPTYRLGEGDPIVESGRSSGFNTLPLVWDV